MVRRIGWLALALGILLLAFQNCGGMRAGGDDVPSTAIKYANDATVGWSMRIQPPVINTLGKIEKWKDAFDKGVLLMPPLKGSALDLDRSPETLAQSNTFLRFKEKQTLLPAAGDFSEFVSDEYTVILVVKNIDIPSADPRVIRLFEMYPVDGSLTGHLGIDIYPVDEDKIRLLGYSYFDASTSAMRAIDVSLADFEKPAVIAMSFPRLPENFDFRVNGVAAEPVVVNGQPPFQGNLGRQLAIHTAGGYGERGEFSFGEIFIWTRALDFDELGSRSSSAIAAWAGDVEIEPTPTPAPTPTPGPTDPETPTFSDVQQALSSCMACHDTKLASRGNLVDSNVVDQRSGHGSWVSAGNSSASKLFLAIQGTGGASQMPPSGYGSLSANQVSLVKQWIDAGAP